MFIFQVPLAIAAWLIAMLLTTVVIFLNWLNNLTHWGILHLISYTTPILHPDGQLRKFEATLSQYQAAQELARLKADGKFFKPYN